MGQRKAITSTFKYMRTSTLVDENEENFAFSIYLYTVKVIGLKQVQDPIRQVYEKSTKSTNPHKKVPERYIGTHTGTIVPVCVPLSVSLLQCRAGEISSIATHHKQEHQKAVPTKINYWLKTNNCASCTRADDVNKILNLNC